jgi:crotonobetainyl-CoA:carnitine CoA-transferase CaiB-like acyl-CoA transferase
VGRLVHVSLIQAAIAALVNQGANYLVGGQIPQPIGNDHPNIVPYGRPFICADGVALVLAVGTDKQFAALCGIFGLESWAAQPDFRTNGARVKNRIVVHTQLEHVFLSRTSAELIPILSALNIPFGRMNTLAEVADLPAAQSMLMRGVNLKGWRSAVFLSENTALSPPPELGQHQRFQQATS